MFSEMDNLTSNVISHALQLTKFRIDFELASCSKDGTIRFWDTRERGKTSVSKLEPGGDLFSMAWSADGSNMVVGSKVRYT